MNALPDTTTATVVRNTPIDVQIIISGTKIAAILNENATLRSLLIDVTGQRNALRQELDRMLLGERVA